MLSGRRKEPNDSSAEDTHGYGQALWLDGQRNLTDANRGSCRAKSEEADFGPRNLL